MMCKYMQSLYMKIQTLALKNYEDFTIKLQVQHVERVLVFRNYHVCLVLFYILDFFCFVLSIAVICMCSQSGFFRTILNGPVHLQSTQNRSTYTAASL